MAVLATFLTFVGMQELHAVETEGMEEQTPQQTNYVKHNGKIGPYAITFFFDPALAVGATDGELVGYYYYNSRPASKFNLTVKSVETINAKGSVRYVLYETSPRGNHTGTFRGQYESRNGYFTGYFTNSKGKKFKYEIYEE